MAPIYDFPRAARAEHGHGTKKCCWDPFSVSGRTPKTTFTSLIGLTDKISGWEPLSEHSKLFLLLFERVVSLR